MLPVTRFNGNEMLLNPELILYIETIPDTVITLTTGEKLYVRDKPDRVRELFMEYKHKVYGELLAGELKVKGD